MQREHIRLGVFKTSHTRQGKRNCPISINKTRDASAGIEVRYIGRAYSELLAESLSRQEGGGTKHITDGRLFHHPNMNKALGNKSEFQNGWKFDYALPAVKSLLL